MEGAFFSRISPVPVVSPVTKPVPVDHLHDILLSVVGPAAVVVGHHPVRRPNTLSDAVAGGVAPSARKDG